MEESLCIFFSLLSASIVRWICSMGLSPTLSKKTGNDILDKIEAHECSI